MASKYFSGLPAGRVVENGVLIPGSPICGFGYLIGAQLLLGWAWKKSCVLCYLFLWKNGIQRLGDWIRKENSLLVNSKEEHKRELNNFCDCCDYRDTELGTLWKLIVIHEYFKFIHDICQRIKIPEIGYLCKHENKSSWRTNIFFQDTDLIWNVKQHDRSCSNICVCRWKLVLR